MLVELVLDNAFQHSWKSGGITISENIQLCKLSLRDLLYIVANVSHLKVS